MLSRRELLAGSLALWQSGRQRLNIVLILVDDLGATDLACTAAVFMKRRISTGSYLVINSATVPDIGNRTFRRHG
jgi:hypothetical protein